MGKSVKMSFVGKTFRKWANGLKIDDSEKNLTLEVCLPPPQGNIHVYSCTPDREILRFTPCEKFLSHPRYLTPVAPYVHVFFFNIGCLGRHVISSLSAHVTVTSKRFNSKWRMPRL